MENVFTKYEYVDHTADLGFRARGDTLEALFVHAAEALFSALVSLETVLLEEERTVQVTAPHQD